MSLGCLADLRPRWEAAGIDWLPYQVRAAERIVEEMDGQGILADEVGLGKTIEAGLVMSELGRRGECESILVLCPAGIVGQWAREMAEKFGLSFAAPPRGDGWRRASRLIASLDQAKREPARSWLLERPFDLVVVDEAHRLKNRRTQSHDLVRRLRRRRLLLLSATPMQNDLTELYSLVSLVRPGLFGSFQAFWRQFLLDRRTPRDPAALRASLAEIMVRHRRQDLPVAFPRREVALLPIDLSPAEMDLYRAVSAAVRQEYHRRMAGGASILPLIALQRELCSSAAALRRTLDQVGPGWRGIGEIEALRTQAAEVRVQTKAEVLQALLDRVDQQVLVYTEFRATQEDLAERLRRGGRPVVLYHGGLSADERDRACRRFQAEPAGVMISTESGGQGLNLQFCRHLVNYDLPWNPMRVEQRIGRVHRLGQAGAVCIYNLYARGTVEEHLLRLLDEKIDLFRRVVGELDVILRRLERQGRRTLESRILEILWGAGDERELAWRFDQLGRQVALALRRVRLAERWVPGAGEPPR